MPEGVGVAQTVVEDRDTGNTVAAVNCYFMCQDGSMFKAQVRFAPYFYLQVQVRPWGLCGPMLVQCVQPTCPAENTREGDVQKVGMGLQTDLRPLCHCIMQTQLPPSMP